MLNDEQIIDALSAMEAPARYQPTWRWFAKNPARPLGRTIEWGRYLKGLQQSTEIWFTRLTRTFVFGCAQCAGLGFDLLSGMAVTLIVGYLFEKYGWFNIEAPPEGEEGEEGSHTNHKTTTHTTHETNST